MVFLDTEENVLEFYGWTREQADAAKAMGEACLDELDKMKDGYQFQDALKDICALEVPDTLKCHMATAVYVRLVQQLERKYELKKMLKSLEEREVRVIIMGG